jgi:hypothetical protein
MASAKAPGIPAPATTKETLQLVAPTCHAEGERCPQPVPGPYPLPSSPQNDKRPVPPVQADTTDPLPRRQPGNPAAIYAAAARATR